MSDTKKQNAPGKECVPITERAGRVIKDGKVLCDVNHINSLTRELQVVGLWLRDASGASQCATLLLLLEYLGPRGLSTPEGHAIGYLRMASRCNDLRNAGHNVFAVRETVIGLDNIEHHGVCRYFLLAAAEDKGAVQPSLFDEVSA